MPEVTSSASPSLDDVLQFIAKFVSERYNRLRTGTNGAVLADAIRSEYPHFSFEGIGVLKLSEAISIAESKGLVTRNRTVKHLEVLPLGTRHTVVSLTRPHASFVPHIRSDIWRAFVFVDGSSSLNFYDRQSGTVLTVSDGSPPTDSDRYIEIKPVQLDVQQRWMEEFAKSKDIDTKGAPIYDPYCFTKFPIWLKSHEASLEREWKRFRVLRVADMIREWASDHNILTDNFFAVARPRPADEQATNAPTADERWIREALLAAIADLPLDQLQDFAIPVRYLLRNRTDR